MPNPGFLYLLINPSMEGLVKIGKPTRDPKSSWRETVNAELYILI